MSLSNILHLLYSLSLNVSGGGTVHSKENVSEGTMSTKPDEDKMMINEPRKYLKRMWPRYLKADREKRGELLTEMQAVQGCIVSAW